MRVKAIPKIAVFDSGVGGLSVYSAIQSQLPFARYIYCSDTANFPYGRKADCEVISAVLEMADKITRKFHPDLLVVACNTASTVALDSLRSRFSIPIVGVVPALKPAALLSQTKIIGLLATPATIERAYTQNLIREFCQGLKVVKLGSSRLVELAEEKLSGKAISQSDIATEISPLFKTLVPDIIVLGCTHFPLLLDELKACAPQVGWLDSGAAIANRVVQLVGEQNSHAVSPLNTAVFSGQVSIAPGLRCSLEKLGFAEFCYV